MPATVRCAAPHALDTHYAVWAVVYGCCRTHAPGTFTHPAVVFCPICFLLLYAGDCPHYAGTLLTIPFLPGACYTLRTLFTFGRRGISPIPGQFARLLPLVWLVITPQFG